MAELIDLLHKYGYKLHLHHCYLLNESSNFTYARGLISHYYVWLSSLTQWLTPPITNLDRAINIPLISALLFGLQSAVAPAS